MTAVAPVDDWTPPWLSFQGFFESALEGHGGALSESDLPYLTELDHERDNRREWTRGEWRRQVAGVAGRLAERGIDAGDTVAVLAGNSADALAVAYACWSMGVCYLPLNAHETTERQAFILRDSRAKLLAFAPSGADRGMVLAENVDVHICRTEELMAVADGWPDGPCTLEAAALRVYTSGTTGEPKGVELTAGNLLTDCDAMRRVVRWDARSRVLVVLPIHHVNGLVVSSLLSWYSGASMVLCDRFRSDVFWRDVREERATVCSMVPTLLEFLLADAERAPEHFTEVLCGAGPLMSDTVLSFEETFGVPVRHLYGLSETTAVATMMPTLQKDERQRWYVDHGFPSIGRALPHVEVQVHDPDGRPLPAGVRGELVMRGATVMTGYAGRPDATSTAFRGGWFHSGDEGFWMAGPDGSPYFFITGRLKELIIRGGVNISPLQIDEVLISHPAVRFGLAVPFDNKYYGEEIAAYVVPSVQVSEQEILDFCADRLDFALQPKVVIFGDDVPFTATGKAKRLSLRQALKSQLAQYREVQFRRRDAARANQEGMQDATR